MKKKRGPQFPLSQFIAIVVITISFFLVVDFARRTASIYRIKSEEIRLEEEVAAVRAQRQDLQDRLNYVQSDAYVEEIARTQLKWTRPGETAVMVLATPQAAPTPPLDRDYVVADMPAPEEPWQAWWIRFFDIPPPQ